MSSSGGSAAAVVVVVVVVVAAVAMAGRQLLWRGDGGLLFPLVAVNRLDGIAHVVLQEPLAWCSQGL